MTKMHLAIVMQEATTHRKQCHFAFIDVCLGLGESYTRSALTLFCLEFFYQVLQLLDIGMILLIAKMADGLCAIVYFDHVCEFIWAEELECT